MDRHFLNRVYARLFRILTSIGVAQRITVTLPLRVGGRRFRIPVVQSVGLRNVTHGDWWLQDILSKLLPDCPGTFLDVGANVGQTLLKVKGCSPDRAWLGFEPNPTCVMYLERLIALNQFKSCTLIPAALDMETGVKGLDCFHTDASDDTASLVKNFRANEKVLRRSWVPVLEFSALGRAGIDEAIGFVKIDVEGAEKEVLESLHVVLVKFRPFIVLEILPVYNEENQERLARQRAVEKQLHNLDYIVCRVEKGKDGHCMGLRPFPEIGIHDQLTWSDYLLVPSEKLDETFGKVGRAYHAGSRDGEWAIKRKST